METKEEVKKVSEKNADLETLRICKPIVQQGHFMLDNITNYESVKNNLYVRKWHTSGDHLDKNLQNGTIEYNEASWIPKKGSDEDLDVNAIYEANYSRSAHVIRWISAVPMAFWDVTVCTIARLWLFVAIYQSEDNKHAHVQFYHIGKNFEMACGRLYGMVWGCDQEGMKIVHAAALNKRLYSLKSRTDTSDETVYYPPLVCQELSKFYAEVLSNKVNVKGIPEDKLKGLDIQIKATKIVNSGKEFIGTFENKLNDFKDAIDKNTNQERAKRFKPSYERLNKIFEELVEKFDEINKSLDTKTTNQPKIEEID